MHMRSEAWVARVRREGSSLMEEGGPGRVEGGGRGEEERRGWRRQVDRARSRRRIVS